MTTWRTAKQSWYGRWITTTRSERGGHYHGFSVPQAGGVYAWYGDGQLLYIGSSENMALRITEHFKRGIVVTEAGYSTPWGAYETLDLKVRAARFFGEWATLELRLIRRLTPPYNKRSTRGSRVPSLRGFGGGR